ncbi:GDYXXLXY domain-containing protein [Paenibacillus hamazuiensis]|uniref:GDYXXLXY domain-containing protein n=1 Tax=Paenibacillus hamazuiensis TaxID=2936508 RepID=UPI00200CAE05|nr:GDYXXLXY domain-containing protein [Paenibacillus hamazuiensis]
MTERSVLKKRSGKLGIVVAAQILFLLVLAGSYWAAGVWGREIRLHTIPVDPRDMLYGDYVTLTYEMSRLKPEMWKEAGKAPKKGDVVYVVLMQDKDGVFHPEAAYGAKPASVSGDMVVMKGRVEYDMGEAIAVRYGLERYYVPEGTGKELEKRAGDMVVRVKIAPWGQARIVGLESSG